MGVVKLAVNGLEASGCSKAAPEDRQYLLDRHGGKVVLFGRFVSILCAHTAFLARTSLQRSSVLR
jgi:hypothetical protein